MIPRYLTIPSLLLGLCVAVALGGWRLIHEPTARRVAIGIAVFSVLVLGLARAVLRPRLPEARRPGGRSSRRSTRGSRGILNAPNAVAAIQGCPPITVPTHSAIPVIRYETGLPKEAVEASIGQRAAAHAGRPADRRHLQLRAERGARDELQPEHLRAQALVNRALPGFERLARRKPWTAYAACR